MTLMVFFCLRGPLRVLYVELTGPQTPERFIVPDTQFPGKMLD